MTNLHYEEKIVKKISGRTRSMKRVDPADGAKTVPVHVVTVGQSGSEEISQFRGEVPVAYLLQSNKKGTEKFSVPFFIRTINRVARRRAAPCRFSDQCSSWILTFLVSFKNNKPMTKVIRATMIGYHRP